MRIKDVFVFMTARAKKQKMAVGPDGDSAPVRVMCILVGRLTKIADMKRIVIY